MQNSVEWVAENTRACSMLCVLFLFFCLFVFGVFVFSATLYEV